MPIRFIDAHNHLQDSRFEPFQEAVTTRCREVGVLFSAVNGSCPEDWPQVAALARQHGWIIPNFGVHPWYISNLPNNWDTLLEHYLDVTPSGIGETGIDGWRKEFDSTLQEEVFLRQLAIAAKRNIPISIHGLRRWGRLLELLQRHPRPECGFLLHSYGGPVEMIPAFAKLGGYFSCPGFFLKPGREMKLSVFYQVPRDRLLVETDAPDQNLPEDLDSYHLTSTADGARINHPCNITTVYQGLATFLSRDVGELSADIERNFCQLFAPVLEARSRDISSISR